MTILTLAPINGQERPEHLFPPYLYLEVGSILDAPTASHSASSGQAYWNLDPARAVEIVARWKFEDPIDHWRKEKKRLDRVWPKKEEPEHIKFGRLAVGKVAALLRLLGYGVIRHDGNDNWDLTVEDCLRIEVKGSRWNPQKGKKGRYQANVRKKQAARADLIIFMTRNKYEDHFFIIPAGELRGRRSLTIRTYNPGFYTGCLSGFRERWDLIEPALEAARQRPQQLSFMEDL